MEAFYSYPLFIIWLAPCFFTVYCLIAVVLCYKLPEKRFFTEFGNNVMFGIFVLVLLVGDYYLIKLITL
jgi:hypothetical protein